MTDIVDDMENLGLRIAYMVYLDDRSNPQISFEDFKQQQEIQNASD